MKKNNLPELLSPAGSPDALDAALAAGADAVYFGAKTLNARHGAENFDDGSIFDAVKKCRVLRSAQGGVLIMDESSQNVVEDCDFRELGLDYKHIGGVVLERGASENLVSHCTINGSSRYGKN